MARRELSVPLTMGRRIILAVVLLRKERERVESLRKSPARERRLADIDTAEQVFRKMAKAWRSP